MSYFRLHKFKLQPLFNFFSTAQKSPLIRIPRLTQKPFFHYKSVLTPYIPKLSAPLLRFRSSTLIQRRSFINALLNRFRQPNPQKEKFMELKSSLATLEFEEEESIVLGQVYETEVEEIPLYVVPEGKIVAGIIDLDQPQDISLKLVRDEQAKTDQKEKLRDTMKELFGLDGRFVVGDISKSEHNISTLKLCAETVRKLIPQFSSCVRSISVYLENRGIELEYDFLKSTPQIVLQDMKCLAKLFSVVGRESMEFELAED
jgi:hypothetical protein